MGRMLGIIQNKPPAFVLGGLVYILIVGFLKWKVTPPAGALWFVGGGILGVYFLDIAEAYIRLTPSPFRSIVFAAMFSAVSLFVVTSSSSLLAQGLVLTLYLMLLMMQIVAWRKDGNLESWYRMIAGSVSLPTQRMILWVFGVLFLIESYLFLR